MKQFCYNQNQNYILIYNFELNCMYQTDVLYKDLLTGKFQKRIQYLSHQQFVSQKNQIMATTLKFFQYSQQQSNTVKQKTKSLVRIVSKRMKQIFSPSNRFRLYFFNQLKKAQTGFSTTLNAGEKKARVKNQEKINTEKLSTFYKSGKLKLFKNFNFSHIFSTKRVFRVKLQYLYRQIEQIFCASLNEGGADIVVGVLKDLRTYGIFISEEEKRCLKQYLSSKMKQFSSIEKFTLNCDFYEVYDSPESENKTNLHMIMIKIRSTSQKQQFSTWKGRHYIWQGNKTEVLNEEDMNEEDISQNMLQKRKITKKIYENEEIFPFQPVQLEELRSEYTFFSIAFLKNEKLVQYYDEKIEIELGQHYTFIKLMQLPSHKFIYLIKATAPIIDIKAPRIYKVTRKLNKKGSSLLSPYELLAEFMTDKRKGEKAEFELE